MSIGNALIARCKGYVIAFYFSLQFTLFRKEGKWDFKRVRQDLNMMKFSDGECEVISVCAVFRQPRSPFDGNLTREMR